MIRWVLGTGLLSLLFGAQCVYAQLSIPGLAGAATITINPAHPTPGANIHLSLESALLDLQDSSITWYVNNKKIAAGIGMTSADVTAGELGVALAIEADVTTADGTAAVAQTSLIPTEVDLLFDANSYIPPFYRGRALPAAGTSLRLQAITRFKKTNGSFVQPSDIIYTWRKNGQVLGSLSGHGRSSALVPAPYLYGADTISVEAVSADDTFSGASSILIPSIQPQLRLYEDHPLFGVLFSQALATTSQIKDREMTFAAVPYFAQAASANDPALSYEWSVNGTRAPASDIHNEITVGTQADQGGGIARIALSMSHATNIFFSASGIWNVTLSSASAVANDLFQPNQ